MASTPVSASIHLPVVPSARVVLAAVLLTVPMLGVLAHLVVTDGLALVPASLTGGAIVTGAWLVVRSHLQELRALADLVRDLAPAAGAAPADPDPGQLPGAVRTLGLDLVRLQRDWRRQVERLRAELRANESILEALHDPLILVAPDGRVVRANAAARALFGDRILDRDLAATLRNPHLLRAVDTVRAGTSSRIVEFTLPVPVERVLEARVKPFRAGGVGGGEDEGETGSAVIVTLHDLTAVRRAEQLRADFVANASHELRTPLSTLLGFIETLRGPARDDPEATERFLAIMHEQAARMSRLVNDLLSLSRIELDEHTPPTGRADVLDLVCDVVASFELKAAARNIRLRVEAPARLPAVTGDADQLSQVFQNLIDNAIKYTREGTEVTITVCRTEAGIIGGAGAGMLPPLPPPPRRGRGLVAVAVTDRGEGIARTHLPRLTERFYRVDTARSRALGGTGLGLAIVKHIVNRHRGRLTIESEVGRGSTFTVYLPLAAEEEHSSAMLPQAGGNAA